MGVLAINNGEGYIELPVPAKDGFSSVTHEISKSSRNALGNLYKFRVAVKAEISCSWVAISPEQKNLILRLTSGNSFNVRYFDSTTSSIKYGKFYRGDDMAIRGYNPFDGNDFRYYDVSFSMVEF